jgi:hypothetical protein
MNKFMNFLKQFSKAVFLFLIVSQMTGQEDANKAFLKHTSVVVHKAQKQMIASGNMNAGGDLAKAVLLQSYAVKLFGKNNNASLCFSSTARELASKVIKGTGAADNAYYSVSEEEKKLLRDCSSKENLLMEAKKNMPAMSMNDSDYKEPKSLNETNIDIK